MAEECGKSRGEGTKGEGLVGKGKDGGDREVRERRECSGAGPVVYPNMECLCVGNTTAPDKGRKIGRSRGGRGTTNMTDRFSKARADERDRRKRMLCSEKELKRKFKGGGGGGMLGGGRCLGKAGVGSSWVVG